ncbi:hypothetical protein ASPCADRAFT_207500, partial [Aspergillus carbonarius ITEM 5010]
MTLLTSLLTSLCSCCGPPKPAPKPTNHHHSHPSQYPPSISISTTTLTHQPTDPYNYSYTSPPTLPAYTPHPHSTCEKTLAAHLRDPPISSDSYNTTTHDEKSPFTNHQDQEEPRTTPDDASSEISFPSTHSYGNTSTATRETPPPPYSPRRSGSIGGSWRGTESPVPSLVMSMMTESVGGGSVGGSEGGGSVDGDGEGMVQIAAPRAVFFPRGRV